MGKLLNILKSHKLLTPACVLLSGVSISHLKEQVVTHFKEVIVFYIIVRNQACVVFFLLSVVYGMQLSTMLSLIVKILNITVKIIYTLKNKYLQNVPHFPIVFLMKIISKVKVYQF